MTTSTPDAIRAKVDSFPSMSPTAAKLLSILSDPDSDAGEIENVLRYDPGLTANILKIANSAYFGGRGAIGSVRQAIVRLGWQKMRQLVVASSVNAVMESPIAGYDLPPGELWRHAVGVSVAAEVMVKEHRLSDCEETFTAALLHDVGKIVLGSFVDVDYEEVKAVASEGLPFEEAEHKVLGTDHAEVGAEILSDWSFPSAMVGAVRWHHEPDLADETTPLLDVVHIADVLCLMLGIGVGREGLQYQPSAPAAKRLGLEPTDLEMIASKTLQGVQELADSLGHGT